MKVIIVGAGIAGLTTALRLYEQNIEFELLEAHTRPGGRIYTINPPNRSTIPLDLGAAWLHDHHKTVKQLIRELRIKRYLPYSRGLSVHDYGAGKTPQQFSPKSQPAHYYLSGGMGELIDKLYNRLPDNHIHLNTIVTHIVSDTDGIAITATQANKNTFFDADYVVVAIPPALASTTITFQPALPLETMRALHDTRTWLGEYPMKVFLVYDSPFWRKLGLSGHSISPDGVINQIVDASPDDSPFGVLCGYIGKQSLAHTMLPHERKQAIIAQVKRTYGWEANEIKYYGEINWLYESYTTDRNYVMSHLSEQPDYGNPRLQQPALNGRLFWGSSEVSTVAGGYVEGAVYRANEIASTLAQTIK